jgi:UDP-N-acetylglucosamine 2-epimerase (non-hydrolysing)
MTEGADAMGGIVLVAGARPNFVKIAPIAWELRARGLPFAIVHTGQHYDPLMSDVFFRDLGIPEPGVHLGVGSGTHAVQTAGVMLAIEPVLRRARPRWVVVVGDVNSTLAAALVAVKLGIPAAHVEAGLRSHDRSMPEEVNRIVTDRISDLLLTPSEDADGNLLSEGIPPDRIVRAGNVMIDCLERHLAGARARKVPESMGLGERAYAVMTLHRPQNVDDPGVLSSILDAAGTIAARLPVVFPVHPRLGERIRGAGGLLRAVDPMSYTDFLGLVAGSRLVLTDSGGLQEETSVLGIPCLTLRANTERPITTTLGTNRLVGVDAGRIAAAAMQALEEEARPARIPLWDGRTAGRIVDALS